MVSHATSSERRSLVTHSTEVQRLPSFSRLTGSENQIKSFVQSKFDVTFPVYAKIRVNGKEEAPLFSFLKDEARGVLGTVDVKWNFQKVSSATSDRIIISFWQFLVDRDGKPIMRYSPMAKPEDIEGDIENALAAPPSHASRM